MGGQASKSSAEVEKKNGVHEDKDDGEVFTEAAENGSAQGRDGSTRRRTSFYETVDASEVLPYLIIGNQASSTNKGFLTRKNVKYILNLTNELEELPEIEYKNVVLEDDDDQDLRPHLETCFEFINRAAKDWQTSSSSPSKQKDKEDGSGKATILVHSYYGMSRSAAIIIAYLMKEKGMSLKDAYELLKERHSTVNPNDNFVVQLIHYEQELFEGNMSMSVKDFH